MHLRPALQVLLRGDGLPCPVQQHVRQDVLLSLVPVLHQGLQGCRGKKSFFPSQSCQPPVPVHLHLNRTATVESESVTSTFLQNVINDRVQFMYAVKHGKIVTVLAPGTAGLPEVQRMP